VRAGDTDADHVDQQHQRYAELIDHAQRATRSLPHCGLDDTL
jgi:hypothetical protein